MRDCGSKYLVEPAGPVTFPRLTGPEVSWFALYVQVNHENEVVKRLENKELTCFLPLMECWSKRVDRRKKIHVPLFPGYVFIHTLLDNYTNVNILKTPGALQLPANGAKRLPHGRIHTPGSNFRKIFP